MADKPKPPGAWVPPVYRAGMPGSPPPATQPRVAVATGYTPGSFLRPEPAAPTKMEKWGTVAGQPGAVATTSAGKPLPAPGSVRGQSAAPQGPQFGTQGYTPTVYPKVAEALSAPGPIAEAAPGIVEGLQAPTNTQSIYDQLQQMFAQRDPLSNHAENAYLDYMQRQSPLAANPNLDKFYDEAERRTINKLNTDFAARGAYGSSVLAGQVADAVTGLEAEKAGREADYQLARAGEMRLRDSLGLDAASAADRSGLMGRESDRMFGQTLAGVASSADSEGLRRLLAQQGIAGDLSDEGFRSVMAQLEAAIGADRLNLFSQDQAFGHLMSPLALLSTLASGIYDSQITGDQATFDEATGLPIAGAMDNRNTVNTNQQQGLNLLMQILPMIFGGMSGGGAGAATAAGPDGP